MTRTRPVVDSRRQPQSRPVARESDLSDALPGAGADAGKDLRVLAVTNMYPTPEDPGFGSFVARQVESLRRAGVAVEVLHLRRTVGRKVYRGLGKRVEREADAIGVDLVHVMYGGVMAYTVTRGVRSCPVIVSFCGTDLLGGVGEGVVGSLSVRANAIASRGAARRADGVIVKSRNLFAALPTGVDASRAWVVPNGVDCRRFRPIDTAECRRRLGWNLDHLHVLFPASPTRPVKRYELARASVELLNGADRHVELHALQDVAHEDVPIWLNASDAVLVTSAHEGSPNAVKEALACNVPVVSVDVGDVRERIEGIERCFITEPTPADIADKLGRTIGRSVRIDARASILELSLERVAEKVIGIYSLVRGRAEAMGAAR